jgi:hypothetical protein
VRLALITGAAIVASGWTGPVLARPSAAATFDEERIEFAPGTDNATREGHVDAGNSDRWILRAAAGQVIDLTVDSADDNTVFSVFAPGHVLLADVAQGTTWSGTLPAAGDYAVEVAAVDGPAYYKLKVWIDAAYRDPLGAVERLSFAPGTDSGSVSGSVVRASEDTWVLGAAAGQTMEVTIASIEDNAAFEVFAPDGTQLTAGAELSSTWSGPLPTDGDYLVVVQPVVRNATYVLSVRIAGGVAQAPPAPSTSARRIAFPAGTDFLSVSDLLDSGTTHEWLVGVSAGQSMFVEVRSESGEVWFTVQDPHGVAVVPADDEAEVPVTDSGDHVVVVTNFGAATDRYVLFVHIP